MSTVYLDYIPSGIPTGSKVTIEATDFTQLEQQYIETTRVLTTLSAEAKGSVEYGPASSSIALSAKNEQEVTQNFQTVQKSETKNFTKWDVTIDDGESYGTVVWKVDVQFGGVRVPIPYTQYLDIWSPARVIQFEKYDMTDAMQTMVSNCGGNPGQAPAHEIATFNPFVGKTCHHVQFLKALNDRCTPDNAYCVDLDGHQFVVCHHWDYNFIGGPGCDCDHINGQDVLLVRAHDLSSLYPA